MKPTYLILPLLLLLSLSCNKKMAYLENDYVVALTRNVTAKGIIYLQATGYAKKKPEAKQNALRNAVRTILFTGVPNSSVSKPLVNDSGAEAKHRAYFDRFFADGGAYQRYVTVNNVDPTKTIRAGRGYQVALDIELNYRALQKELETAGIISKLGL